MSDRPQLLSRNEYPATADWYDQFPPCYDNGIPYLVIIPKEFLQAVTSETKRLIGICPSCQNTSPTDAAFCTWCGEHLS